MFIKIFNFTWTQNKKPRNMKLWENAYQTHSHMSLKNGCVLWNIVMWFSHCANTVACTYANPHSMTFCTPRLCGMWYVSMLLHGS
jgi:hypothetical protein